MAAAERDLTITGQECSSALRRAADFCDRLEDEMPGTYTVNSFEAGLGEHDVPFALLNVGTDDKLLGSLGAPVIHEGTAHGSNLLVSYNLGKIALLREYAGGGCGAPLRAVSEIAEGLPFPVLRAAGSIACGRRSALSLTIEAASILHAQRDEIDIYLTKGGWRYKHSNSPLEHRTRVMCPVTGRDGILRTYIVNLDYLG